MWNYDAWHCGFLSSNARRILGQASFQSVNCPADGVPRSFDRWSRAVSRTPKNEFPLVLIVCFLRIERQIPTGTFSFKCGFSIAMVWSFRCSSADGWKLPQLLNLFSLALATARALSGISWVYPPQAILQQSPPGWLKNMFWPADSYRPSFATVDPIDTLICNLSFFHLVINSLVGLGPCGFWNCSIHLCNALILRCFSD